MSTNRTIVSLLLGGLSLIGSAAGQDAPEKAEGETQVSVVERLVESMVKAEKSLKSLRLTMTTTGKLPGGLDVVTKGELRVLRETQDTGAQLMFSKLEYSFGDGMTGRMEAARTKAGITIFEADPAFGAVFLRIEPSIVRDLKWASEVLQKSDLPGMADSRAESPLGSGMVGDLARIFELAPGDDTKHGDHQGTWLRGARKAGLDAQDPDLPLADRVEVFVRGRDQAMLLARFFVGKDVVQELKVEQLKVGAELSAKDFAVDGHGERIRSVREYAPMWEQISEAIASAEQKGKELPPSKRQKDGSKKGDKAGAKDGK